MKNIELDFAKQFIEAVQSGSIERCTQLIISFEEYQNVTGDDQKTYEDYAKALDKQCSDFFDEHKNFIDKKNAKFLMNNIKFCEIYGLSEEYEISDDFSFCTMKFLSITMKEEILENGDISSLAFQIDDPMIINSNIKVNNFMLVKAYESIDDSIKNLKFQILSKKEYLNIMEGEPFQFTNEMADAQWFIHEGDLSITSAQVKNLSTYSFLVSGDLIVDGVLDYRDTSSLFVLGDVKAKSILLSLSTCYFAGTTYFDEALVIMGGSGSVVDIKSTEGLFVYTDSDAAQVNVSNENVQAFVDHSYGYSFGDVSGLLDERFLKIDNNDIYIEVSDLCEAIFANEAFMRH